LALTKVVVVLRTLGVLLSLAMAATGSLLLWIARDLLKRWRRRIVEWLDNALRRVTSRFQHRYRDFMLGSLRFIDLKGLATIGFYTPELAEVFVDVSLAYRAPHQVPDGVLTQLPPDVTDRHSIREFLDRPEPVVLAVIGVPGSGKTTLLRHTARTACRERRGRRRSVPILLYLRDHVTAIASTPDIALPELVRTALGKHGPHDPPGWFEQRLRDGDCEVLLDGLDEVASHDHRGKVAAWVERQTKLYSKNDFVITSRPQGYRSAGISGAVVLQVRGFTDEQVSRFVHGWYLAVERHSTGTTDEVIRRRAAEAADDLLQRLNSAASLYDLTVNPLLLTMIANVHRYRGALPGSRADLYSEICQVMLWRRHEAKHLPVELDGDRKEMLLRSLAFTMMRRRVRDLPRAEVLAELSPALRRMSTRLTEKNFLADASSNGLLIERENDQFSFAHLTFQEYLAAAHIRDKGLVDILTEAVDDIWWRETTLLYVTRADADPIVKACLASGSHPALSLAFDCADLSGELAPELRSHLEELLDDTSDQSSRRELVRRVVLTRHLRDLIRTGTGSRVCARPVTTRIYRTIQLSSDLPVPDGPLTGLDDPVTGIYLTDARSVAGWANAIIEGDYRYRLPHLSEMDDPAVQRSIAGRALCVWLDSGDLWTPPGSAHPHTIDAATLAHHVGEDFKRSASTLAYLLLFRAIIGVRTLTHDYHRVNPALIRELVHTLQSILDPLVDLDLDHALDRSFYQVLDLNPGVEFNLDRAVALVGTLAPVFSTRFTPDRDRDLNGALERGLSLAQTFARIRDSDVDAKGLGRVLGLDRALLSDGRYLGHELGSAIGHGLSFALSQVLARTPNAADWPTEFSREFLNVTGVSRQSWTVSPDRSMDRINSDTAGWLTLNVNTWATRVAIRSKDAAALTNPPHLSSDEATVIRLAALALAAEADKHDLRAAGDNYREIAAGITLMERRAHGMAPASETIMLAMA
jgi:hypothetical protein